MKTILATLIAIIVALGLIRINPTVEPPITTETVQAQAMPAEAVKKTDANTQSATPPVGVVAEPTAEIPATPTQTPPATTCAAEINKYSSWNQGVAYNVMMAESGNAAETVNDNPATGDLSFGCFQVNLLGSANLIAKFGTAKAHGYTGAMDVAPLSDWLHNPANNVAVAEDMYRSSGWAPWKYTCLNKVQCY